MSNAHEDLRSQDEHHDSQQESASLASLTTPVSRGRLLRLTGAGIQAGVLAYAGAQALGHSGVAAAASVPPPQPATNTAAETHHLPLRFFNSAQAAVITAMAERIFPADKTGPGATDAHVVDYIDGQLAGAWGWGIRMYLQGPFPTPTSSGFGWQIPQVPRDLYTDALAAIDAYCQQKYQTSFDQLDAKTQDALLTMMSLGKFPMSVTSVQFFATFYENVREGLFADPIYGGNYNFIGWKWVKFPGNPMAYGDPYANYIDKFNYAYNVAPKGLADQMY